MDRERHIAPVIANLGEKLPYINFYRFCQYLEKSQPTAPALGSTASLAWDPIRFRPHSGLGFPVSELKGRDPRDNYRQLNVPSINTTFIGLYGVTSPLPTHYLDDIAQHQEGTESLTDFLDIFNHRLTTQFYRIWRKYSYPATFETGGRDKTSQYLLGLIGLGVDGCEQQIRTPLSRFLALLGTMRLPTRTEEGLASLVALLAPQTVLTVSAHDPRQIFLATPTTLSCQQPISLAQKPVLGRSAIDVNSQLLLQLYTDDPDEATQWLPHGSLYQDFLALLHVYLGARVNARLRLKIPRALLPDATLCQQPTQGVQLGRTAVMRQQTTDGAQAKPRYITIGLGHYQRLSILPSTKRVIHYGNYHF